MIRRLVGTGHGVLRAGIGVVLLAGALAGCGIPDNTPVREDGSGPVRGYDAAGRGSIEPPKRTDSTDVAQFVANFLQAAAGESSGAYARVREYIAPVSRDDLHEPQGPDIAVNVVRLTEESPSITDNPDGSSVVTISVRHVGVLRPNGVVEPPELDATKYTFVVGTSDQPPDEGLFVKDPPPVLLMSTYALEEYYESLPIYFWSGDRTSLVPDLRYLPKSVPQERWATEVRDWLIDGPSDWLQDSVSALPPGTKGIGNVTRNDSRFVVNLAIEFGSIGQAEQAEEVRRLGTQLAWSLLEVSAPDGTTGEIDLSVRAHRDRFPVEQRRQDFPLYSVAENPQRFVIYDGAVHLLTTPESPGPRPVPISPEINKGVLSAGLSLHSGIVRVALVTEDGDHRRLAVGTAAETVDSLARSGRFRTMGRPVWLRASTTRHPLGLVVADGRLYRFDRSARLTPLNLAGTPGTVTAVGAGIGGHRIAFVVDGELYVAAVAIDGETVSLGPARRLPTSLRKLSAVDWSGENTLVVAGFNADNRAALYDLTVDGAVESVRVETISTASISHVSAYPGNPVRPKTPSRVLYEANQVAWDGLTRIEPNQVAGLSENATGATTAPFFLY